jgi:hypothetical protein
MRSLLRPYAVLILLCTIAPLYAGGPLYTDNGKAMRYQSNIITYKVDRGPFGIFTSAEARNLAESSFKTWEDVATSNVAFNHTAGDTLPVDVDGTNYLQYTTLTDFKYDGINPIIFDSDGAITDALFGAGASDAVIGFAGSGDNNNDGFFDEGESVMNGVFADGGAFSYTLAEWKSTFVHEFGHFLGLDHAQINGEFENDAAKTIYIPTMYPFATINDTPLGDLNPDDIAAISVLYPETGFAASVGTISGTVVRANGSIVRGANIVAISTGTDSLMNRISTVTDYFVQTNGSFAVVGLTPGSYVLRMEPIDQNFIEGSSVGPYAADLTDLSFINPVTMEYYNGINESSDPLTDDPNAKVAVNVTAGGSIANINFIGNAKPAAAATLLTDEFTYSGLLTANGWTSHSGTSNFLTTTTGLTYSGYSNNTGNAAAVSNLGGEDVNKGFDEISGNGDVIYSSLLINVNDAAAAKTGDYFFHLGNRTSSISFTLFTSRLFARIVSGNVNFGASNSSTATYGATNFVKNTVYYLVMKYINNTAGNDELKLWVFSGSAPTTEAAAGAPLVTNSGTAGQDVTNAVGIRQGSATNSPSCVIDGIRIGTTWPGTPTGVATETTPLVPTSVELMQNYPNPFNPTTSIRFALPAAQHASVYVFDVLGRRIMTLADGMYPAGSHEVRMDASSLSSGTYFYTLETNGHHTMKRMMLIK